MTDSFTQIYIHAIFTVNGHNSLIRKSWEERLYQYITGIVRNHGHKLLALNGMPDHVHMLLGMNPNQSLSNLMRDVKGDSSLWINKNNFVNGKFSWQEGYGAFTYSKSDIHDIATYIENQDLHHLKMSFIEEYVRILKEFEVDYDVKYIFKPVID